MPIFFSKTPSNWVAMLLRNHSLGRRLTWWLCRRGFTMPSLPMLRPNEPGFHLNTNHFHKLEKHVVSNNTFKVTNTYTMVMFDLNHLGSLPQIIPFVVSKYGRWSFSSQPARTPCSSLGRPQRRSSRSFRPPLSWRFFFFVRIFSRYFWFGNMVFPSSRWIPTLVILCNAPLFKTNSLKVEFDFYITEATRFARWVKFFCITSRPAWPSW